MDVIWKKVDMALWAWLMTPTQKPYGYQVLLILNFQITGGSSGIGLAAAILFAAKGANVTLVARNKVICCPLT